MLKARHQELHFIRKPKIVILLFNSVMTIQLVINPHFPHVSFSPLSIQLIIERVKGTDRVLLHGIWNVNPSKNCIQAVHYWDKNRNPL